MKVFQIELAEVFSHWLKDPSDINIRLSALGTIQVIRYQSQVKLEIHNPSPSDQVHLLIQSDNIVLGSLTVTIEWMFGNDLKKELDDWINIEAPPESISLITKQQPKDVEERSLRVRLVGNLSAKKEFETESHEKKTNVNIDSPHESHQEEIQNKEETKAHHAKKPSETDSLEKEYKSPKAKHSELIQESISPIESTPENNDLDDESKLDVIAAEDRSNSSQIRSPEDLQINIKSPQSKSPKALNSAEISFVPNSPRPTDKSVNESLQQKSVSPLPNSSQELFVSPLPNDPINSSPVPKSQQVIEKSPISPKENIEKSPLPQATEEVKGPNKPHIDFSSISPDENKKKGAEDDEVSLGSSELDSENEEKHPKEEQKIEPTRQRPKKITLETDSIQNPCDYLKSVSRTEWHIRSVMNVLSKLKEEMGGSFLKLLEESTRRDSRSPTRSPSRKLTNSGLRTPLVSQRSLNSSVLSSFRVEEDNILDIPGNVDVFLDRVSVKNTDILVNCAVGLLAKIAYGEGQSREIDPTKAAIAVQEKSKNMIQDSMKATETEFNQEKDNYEVMIKRLKDEISSVSQSLESTKKKNELLRYEKSSHQQTLEKLENDKDDILKKYNVNVDLEGIKQLKKANDTLEKNRAEIEERIAANAVQFKSFFDSLSSAQSRFIEEKSSLLSEIKSISSIIDNIERENHKIKSEMQGLNGFIYVDDELRKMLVSYQSNSRMHSQSLDSMRTQLTYLRSHKEDQAMQAHNLHQKLESDTKKVKNSQTSWNKEIESNTDIITELNKEFKKLKQEVAYIEDVYNKKINIDNVFEMVFNKSKHNTETKDQLIGELSYFSDFVFSLSQTFLQQKRIYARVKAIVGEKEIEVEAMRSAVSEIKNNNPVYFPVPDDIIDQAIADYFNSRDDVLIVPFVRESFGVYLYGSKRVMINIERGKLIVKVGGGFLPIEVFIDNYTDIELDKYGNKPLEASPKMKRFMAKWVGGLNPKGDSPEKLREGLVKAMEGHRFTSAYGVKDQRVLKKVNQTHEDFATPPRAETPIIEEDI